MADDKKNGRKCSFCNRPENMVNALLEGTNALICDLCIDIGKAQIDAEVHSPKKAIEVSVPNPRDLVSHLDDYIIGQTYAKRQLSVSVANHYKRILSGLLKDIPSHLVGIEIAKSNILLIGPTGCGKTALAKSLATKVGVPFAIGDATTVTEAGYVGEDVENLILKLVQAADFDIEVAEKGIIYIDEIDKIAKTGGNRSLTRDVSGEGVQQALLKLVEGTIANIPPTGGRKHPEQKYLQVDTTNILFICGGAFVGLEDIISHRLGKSRIGFNQPEDKEKRRREMLAEVIEDDLVEFGLIPELVGRLPIISSLQALSEADLCRILTEPKDAITKQYQYLAAVDKVNLQFTEDALKEIARQAATKGTGARALRSVMEKFMIDICFDLAQSEPGKTYLINEAVVRGERNLFAA